MIFSQQIFLNTIEDQMQIVIDEVADIIINKWVEGGHPLTGGLVDDLKKHVHRVGNKIFADIWLNSYYKYVNEGVAAEDIPFNPGSGAGESLYIQGLIQFFQLRAGLSLKDATGAAFGTAHKHLSEGMPLDKSRLGFFSDAMEEADGVISDGIAQIFGEAMIAVITHYQSKLVGSIKIVL